MAGLINNVDNVNGQNTNAVENQDSADNENIDDFVETVETVVDEGDANPESQSILQNVGSSSSGANSGSVSL